VVKLAVIPAGAIGLLQVQDRDVVLVGEVAHVAPKAVPDLLDDDRRGDGLTQAVLAESFHLTTHLEVGDVGVEVQPVHALDVEDHMTLEHVVDVHHAGHPHSVRARGSALPCPTVSAHDGPRRGVAGRGA